MFFWTFPRAFEFWLYFTVLKRESFSLKLYSRFFLYYLFYFVLYTILYERIKILPLWTQCLRVFPTLYYVSRIEWQYTYTRRRYTAATILQKDGVSSLTTFNIYTPPDNRPFEHRTHFKPITLTLRNGIIELNVKTHTAVL